MEENMAYSACLVFYLCWELREVWLKMKQNEVEQGLTLKDNGTSVPLTLFFSSFAWLSRGFVGRFSKFFEFCTYGMVFWNMKATTFKIGQKVFGREFWHSPPFGKGEQLLLLFAFSFSSFVRMSGWPSSSMNFKSSEYHSKMDSTPLSLSLLAKGCLSEEDLLLGVVAGAAALLVLLSAAAGGGGQGSGLYFSSSFFCTGDRALGSVQLAHSCADELLGFDGLDQLGSLSLAEAGKGPEKKELKLFWQLELAPPQRQEVEIWLQRLEFCLQLSHKLELELVAAAGAGASAEARVGFVAEAAGAVTVAGAGAFAEAG
eukprot:1583656-Pleurochrysis_carterae.AAC.3